MAKKSSRNGVPTAPCPVAECREWPCAVRSRVDLLLEEFSQCTHRMLSQCDLGERRLAFLAQLGFNLHRLNVLPIGLFASDAAIVEHLRTAGFTDQEIEASELVADPRLLGRFVGPIRDPEGRIVSFWARHPAGHRPRFLFKGRWKDDLGLFGLDVALREESRGREHLLVVEPLLDAILLQNSGLPNVAATCDRVDSLPLKRWRRVAAMNFRRITLVLPLPEARHRQLSGLFELLQLAGLTADIFLFCPESSAEIARYVGEEGRERLLAIVKAESIHLSEIGRRKDNPQDAPQDVDDPVQPEPVSEPDPVVSVVEPSPALPVEAHRPAPLAGKQADFCQLHRCRETKCFCFD